MTSVDIVLVLIIAAAFLVGFLWGIIRSLLMVAGWFVVFVIAAILSVPVGDYLTSQWTSYGPEWNHMAAFAILYVGLLILSMILCWMGVKGAQGLSKYPLLDDVASGTFMALVAVLGITGVIVVLASAYAGAGGMSLLGPDWTRQLYQNLLDSQIGSTLQRTIIPLLGTVLGPLLPTHISRVMV
ncbi:MAG: CvpA family protein [Chloroflexi bacterium]|nr:CvpA family protein [Chloroflexota bacterium]